MCKEGKRLLCWFLAVAVVILLVSPVLAVPRVTKVELSTSVAAGYYLTMLDRAADGMGIWIDPGAHSGSWDVAPGPPNNRSNPASRAEMFGLNTGYGQLLLSVTAAGEAEFGSEMANLVNNKPTNANTEIFGSAQGPVNKINIELDRAIPAGTIVTFTVDMNGEPPHLVAVMGGRTPVVTYDPNTDTLKIETATFGTTTNDGDVFNSLVGFMIFTDTTSFGTTPLRLIAQTDHWVGDIFMLLPGFDDHAAIADIGGVFGTGTAKCGTTIYGPSGQQRTASLFVPDAILDEIFGAQITADSLAAFVNSDLESGATLTKGVTNFGVTGTQAECTYTFASPKDVSFGVSRVSSGVNDPEIGPMPSVFSLRPNYPNPFNPQTVIGYSIPERCHVNLTVYNVLGQPVRTLVDETKPGGSYTTSWDGRNASGQNAVTGIYFYRIKAGEFVKASKMLLLK